MIKADKTHLSGPPDQVRKLLDEIFRDLKSYDAARVAQLRSLAVELAQRDDVNVSAVAYGTESMELEVTLPGDRGQDPAILSLDMTGRHCQVSVERWLDIGDESSVTEVASFVAALLHSAAPFRLVRGADG